MTRATFGPRGGGSSTSAALQSSLENKLQAKLGANGSPEYSLTWKRWPMPLREPICALRASGRRTSGKDCGGWPTASQSDGSGGRRPKDLLAKTRKSGAKIHITLNHAAHLAAAGWPTPKWKDGSGTGGSEKEAMMNSLGVRRPSGASVGQTLKDYALIIGKTPSGHPAPTEKRGALNPELSRWLMGYPAAWGSCGATAMQSSRKWRRRS